jgi:acyl carrier protein
MLGCFRIVFPNLNDNELMNISDMNNENWNSLTVIQLISSVEKEFGKELDLDHIEKLTSFKSFMKEIQ